MAIDLNSFSPDEGHGEEVPDLNKAAPVDGVEQDHVEIVVLEEQLHAGTHSVFLLPPTCGNS